MVTGKGMEALKQAVYLFEGEKEHPEFYVWIDNTGVYRAQYVHSKIIDDEVEENETKLN